MGSGTRRRWGSAIFLVAALLARGAQGDAGVVLEIDAERFELVARDLDARDAGPRVRVALGSPAHPTPRGEFRLERVIRNPAWHPGPRARAAGARSVPPSEDGPLGVAKIPFADSGSIALHGGAHPLLLGKPVSMGCVRSADVDLLGLLEWLEERGALGVEQVTRDGERHLRFRRPASLVVR